MKKLVAPLLLCFLASVPARAQQVIFQEDFDGYLNYSIGGGWNTSLYTGFAPWQAGEMYLVMGSCFGGPFNARVAGICDCGWTGSANNNVLMYSPGIDLTITSNPWLKFDSYFYKAASSGKEEKATIEVSTDNGFSWTVIYNVPATADIMYAENYYLDLSAFKNSSNVKIGFRYNDGGLQMGGWAVDNVEVTDVQQRDLKLASVTPDKEVFRYAAINQGIKHTGTVFNTGLETVYSFVAGYQQQNGAIYSETISGVTIPPFTSYTFTYSAPNIITSGGEKEVKLWVSVTGDNNPDNDTLTTIIKGAYFMPQKLPVLEEGTATWSSWSPKGWVYMNRVPGADVSANLISVHGGDPMENDAYSDYLHSINYNYIPYILIDREKRIDLNKKTDSFFYHLVQRTNYFGYADLHLTGKLTGSTYTLNVNVRPAVDLEGEYRLALVITEDSVKGTTDAWAQKNKFATGLQGPMEGFENKPDPVPAADMVYNFVARSIQPGPSGMVNSLPLLMEHEQLYQQVLTAQIDPSWSNRLKAVVLLIRTSDNVVLNSNKIQFYLSLKETAMSLSGVKLYPNPSDDMAKLDFHLPEKETLMLSVCDPSGRVLIEQHGTYEAGNNKIDIPTARLPAGLYMLNITTPSGKQTIKLQVLH